MKKFFKTSLPVVLAFTLLFCNPVFAKQVRKTAELAYNNIKIYINGNELTPTDAAGNIVEPFIINGTTYLPVRAVSNAFNKNVEWDAETQSVYISDKVVYNKTKFPAYNEKISEYIEASNVGWDIYCARWIDDSSINSESMRAYYHYDHKLLAYALWDLDENGTPELIFSNLSDPMIYDIYTINDGTLIKLFDDAYFGDRSRLYILSNGKLLTEGSSSAFESSMELHSLKFGCSVSVEESYYVNTREDDIFDDYYREGKEISIDEYLQKLDKLKEMSMFDKLDWVVFAQ